MVRDPPLSEGGGWSGTPPPSWHLGAMRRKFFLPSARSAEKNFPFGAQRRKIFFRVFKYLGTRGGGGWSGPPLDPRGGGVRDPPPPPCTFFRSHKALIPAGPPERQHA